VSNRVKARKKADPEMGPPVTLAYVYGYNVTHSWHRSIVELIGWDLANSGSVLQGGTIAMHCGTDGLVEARNKAVEVFLDEKKADWLFWIDTDMGFPPDTVDALLAAADPEERPMVGGLCFAATEIESDGLGGFKVRPTPTIYDWAKVPVYDDIEVGGRRVRKHLGDHMGFAVRWNYTRDVVTQVAGTGSACVLIHRSVFEKVEEKHGTWYKRIPNPTTGQLMSEDLSFCMRVADAGFPIYVHTGVKTNHQKLQWVSETVYWRDRAAEDALLQVVKTT